MTYEEACRELDACCCDWRLKKAAFDLEKINYETTSKENLSELQEVLDDILMEEDCEEVSVEDAQKYKNLGI